MRPAAEAVDGMFVADGGIVDREEEGEFRLINDANVVVPVQFGTFTDESG